MKKNQQEREEEPVDIFMKMDQKKYLKVKVFSLKIMVIKKKNSLNSG